MKKTCSLLMMSLLFLPLTVFCAEEDIIEAAKAGDALKIKALLEANPELLMQTDLGIGATALHWACIYGRKDAAAVILAHKPDVNTEEAHGGTTMHWAAHYNDAEVIGWLLDHGADIDHVNSYGRTPLMVAARRNCTDVIERLLERGAKIDTALSDGNTALFIAAKNGHAKTVKLLLSRGADKNARNDQGQTYEDVLFTRPNISEVDPKLYDLYAGLYERENGGILDIRKENNRLFYYAFGKDELQPISEIDFIMASELGYFTFIKDATGHVNEVIYKIGNSEYKAIRRE